MEQTVVGNDIIGSFSFVSTVNTMLAVKAK
jgi:hypothetical protein